MELVPALKVVETMRSTLVMRLAEPDDGEAEDDTDALSPLQQLLIDIYEMRPSKQKDLINLEGRDGSAQSTISRRVHKLTEQGLIKPESVELTREGELEAERLIDARKSSST